MNLHLEDWHILTLLGSMFGLILGYGKLVLNLIAKRLDERFDAADKARDETRQHWNRKFKELEEASKLEAHRWQDVERELLVLKADLPLYYVRREDFIANQTKLENKIDGLAVKIDAYLRAGK